MFFTGIFRKRFTSNNEGKQLIQWRARSVGLFELFPFGHETKMRTLTIRLSPSDPDLRKKVSANKITREYFQERLIRLR